MEKLLKDYRGVIVPMVSPFTENGKIDAASASKLMNFLMDHHSIPFILGTNGEGNSVSMDQREVLVKCLIEQKREGIPTIAGVIGLPFRDTIETANRYLDWGAEAVVIPLPNYYPLTKKQVQHYFELLSDEIKGYIILYNIPKTIHMSVPIDVIDQLSYRDNIIGLKDSEKDEKRMDQSLAYWKDRNDFLYLIGVNGQISNGLLGGADGIVPSTGNIHPLLYHEIYTFCERKKIKEASRKQKHSNELSAVYQKDLLLGESIATLKGILSGIGLCEKYVLPPLTLISKEKEIKLKGIIDDLKKFYPLSL